MYFSRIDLAALEVLPSGFFLSLSFLPTSIFVVEAVGSPSFGGAATSMTVLPSGTSAEDGLLESSPSRERSNAAISSSASLVAAGAGSVLGGGVAVAAGAGALATFEPVAASAGDDLVGGAGVGRLMEAFDSRRTANTNGPTLSWSL